MSSLADAPCYIVHNAGSGRGEADAARLAIEEAFGAANRGCHIFAAASGQQLPELARRAAHQAREANGVLVACGGDGTLNAVAQLAWRHQLPFGILPQGTFNYFGRTWGIPADAGEASRLLLEAEPRAVQVGRVNERLFLINASIGLYPHLLEERELDKRRFGRSRWVALGSALTALLHHHRPLQLQLDCDGQPRSLVTPTLVVDNNPLQLEQIGIEQRSALGEGRLVALAPRPVGLMALYGMLLRGAVRQLGAAEDLVCFDFEQLQVMSKRHRGNRAIKVALDGEIFYESMPLTIQVAPHPLQLMVPPGHQPAGLEPAKDTA